MGNFTDDELIERAFHRAATVMFGMWEETGNSDTRLLLPPLIPDKFVIVGESFNGKEHREHVIPRNVICYKCHEMFEEGLSIDDVASFIRKHLLIVFISREEQHRLDSGKELNLRQRMPDGWSFGCGNLYARFEAANIKVNFKSSPLLR
jgi:hypothetical protein